MGFINKEIRDVAVEAYESILRTFHSLSNIHGFMYYILFFGVYVQLVAATSKTDKKPSKKDKSGGKDLYTDAKVAKASFSDMHDEIGLLIQLRNAFAHWNVENIIDCISILSEKNLPTGSSFVHECVRTILSTDWDMIKRELSNISPQIKF